MADWRDSFEIVWHGDTPPDGVEKAVRDDMLADLHDLSRPSQLVFHTVILSHMMDGPSVMVWGERRDRRFHAEYAEHTNWVTLDAALQEDTQ